MIREHLFNTEWWGSPVGIVEIDAFLSASSASRRRALKSWSWVECTLTSATAEIRTTLASEGFVHADTTVQFRLDLRRVALSQHSSGIAVRRGTDFAALDLSNARPFVHERFHMLRGATQERVMARYLRWANHVHRDHPETVLQFEVEGRAAGWFLSVPKGRGLDLALAMTSQDGRLSGATLYRDACALYARDGFHIGEAGFSARNLDVLNVYAALGARFFATRDCFLWQPDGG